MELCARCKKRVAVIFISKIDGDKSINEGICIKCAKELGIKPVVESNTRIKFEENGSCR